MGHPQVRRRLAIEGNPRAKRIGTEGLERGREMNDSLAGGLAVVKAAASRRTPELWGHGVQQCWTPTKARENEEKA